MQPGISHLITYAPADFNAAPLEALKKLDNELLQVPFYAAKGRKKTDTKSLDLSQPLREQFNLFKMREFDLDAHHVVIDIAPTHLKNAGEDDFFIQDEKVLEICRRGFCVLFNRSTKEQRILRLGLRKFFYLDISDIGGVPVPEKTAKTEQMKGENKNKNAPSHQDPKIVNLTTDKIKALAAKGVPFRMIGTSKLNGENLQITFDGYLKAWVVCSKNVTIITADFSDLDRYRTNLVYAVAMRIVEKWQQTLAKVGPEREAELKDLLVKNRWSLVGEICGNIRMMHPVHYETEDLYFYAISVCEFGRSCLNPTQSSRIFEHIGLRHIKPLFEDVIVGPQELMTKIPAAVEMVNRTSADKVGEGVVMYFCGLEESSESFLLVKVKSFEYVAFRKLRETLKKVLPARGLGEETEEDEEEAKVVPEKDKKGKQKAGNIKENYIVNGKFSPEVHKKLKELIPAIQKFIPDKPLRSLEYYSQLCLKALCFIRDPKAAAKVWENFPCFVRAIQFAMDRNMTLTADNIDSIISTVWSLSVRFYKVEPHLKMYPHVETVRHESTPKPLLGASAVPKHVKVVVPVTILGSGKSYIFEKLACVYRDQGWVTFLVSSDELSAYVIEKKRFVDNNFDPNHDYFNASRAEYRSLWGKSIDQVFERPLEIDAQKFVILVDKNHHPFHFRKILKEYGEKLAKLGFTYDFVHIFTDSKFPMEWNLSSVARLFHPMSAKLFYDSFVRINGRKDNVLMQNTTPESNLKILSEFYSFFIDYNPKMGNQKQTVYFRRYDESNPEFVGKVDAALGPVLRAFLAAKKAGEKSTDKYLADFMTKFNKFYAENRTETTDYLFPTIDDFEDSVEANREALFGTSSGMSVSDMSDIDGIAYGGYFIDPKTFQAFCGQAFRDISEHLQDQPHTDPEALKFVQGVASQGVNRKEWEMVVHPHMTSVYLGGNPPTKEATEVWERCLQHKMLTLELVGMVYAVSKLAFFLVKPTMSPLTLNKVPHVSIMRAGRYTFYDSNLVAKALLDKGVSLYGAGPAVSTHVINDLHEEGAQTKVHVFRMRDSPLAASLRKMYG